MLIVGRGIAEGGDHGVDAKTAEEMQRSVPWSTYWKRPGNDTARRRPLFHRKRHGTCAHIGRSGISQRARPLLAAQRPGSPNLLPLALSLIRC